MVLIVLGGLAANWWFSNDQVLQRQLANVAAVPAKQLLPGQVAKVSGRVVLTEALEAPLSGAACAYWRVKVEAPDGDDGWKVKSDTARCTSFLLDDGSGQPVLVHATSARLSIALTQHSRSSMFKPLGSREAEFLERMKLPTVGMLGMDRQYRFHEGVLARDEEVSVLGQVDLREVDGVMRVVLVPPPDGDLVISDAPAVHG